MLLESQAQSSSSTDTIAPQFNVQSQQPITNDFLLSRANAILQSLKDGDIHIGRLFLKMIDKTGCSIIVNPDLKYSAQYVSYSYADEMHPFINEIAVNPERAADIFGFIDSLIHEGPHAFQKYRAPALHHSPFNRQTKVIVHPLEWIRLENLCERDAYTKEAWINSRLSKTHPSIIDSSRCDAVSVAEFEAIRAGKPLTQAITDCAVTALDKQKYCDTSDYFFSDHYVGVALRNYSAGMVQRMKNNESRFTFVRLEDQDLHAVGDYDLGPNPFGKDTLDARFHVGPRLLPEAQMKLDGLCRQYNIPSLKSCMTLHEYAHKQKAEMSFDTPALSMQSLELS